ncbi:hypothetical protein KEM54_004126 [Ascosphaera aggregata]|nr:hypothetical protein KEM54_004126 [Ascosphaera aggregata]
MRTAREEVDGDYMPPHNFAYDSGRQYVLRKRKFDENLHHVVESDGLDFDRAERPMITEDECFPPRPRDSDMTLTQENYPSNWFCLTKRQRHGLIEAERVRLTELRMRQAFDCYEQHLFPNLTSAARHFRVSIKSLRAKIPELKRKGQVAQEQHDEPPQAQNNTGDATFGSIQLESKPMIRTQPMNTYDNATQSENTRQQSCSHHAHQQMWTMKPETWRGMSNWERKSLRDMMRGESVEYRQELAVDCYNRGYFKNMNDSAQFFRVPLKSLREIAGSRASAPADKGLKSKQTKMQKAERDTTSQQAITSREEMTKSAPTIAEQSQKDTTLAPQVRNRQEKSSTESCVDNANASATTQAADHPTYPGPFNQQEELALVEEVKRRVKSRNQPTLARLRDMANVRVRERDGLNAPTVQDDWIIAFIHRHDFLKWIYAFHGYVQSSAPKRGTVQVASIGSRPPPQVDEAMLDSGDSNGNASTLPSAEELPAVKKEPTAASNHVASQLLDTIPDHLSGPINNDLHPKRPLAEPISHYANQNKPEQAVTHSTSIVPTRSQSSHDPAPPGLENTRHPTSNPPPYEIETRLRVTYNDDTRIIAVDSKAQFPPLMRKIKQKFGSQHSLRMQLADKDGMVTIGDQEDLDIILADTRKWAMRKGMYVVQLQVRLPIWNAFYPFNLTTGNHSLTAS